MKPILTNVATLVATGLVMAGLQPARALDRYTWTAGSSSSNEWNTGSNWDDDVSGYMPDDPGEEAYFNTWTGGDRQPYQNALMSNGLSRLTFDTAGWHIYEVTDRWLKLTTESGNGGWNEYNAIFSSGSGTNTIHCGIEFLIASQNVYPGSGNTLSINGGFRGSYGPIISSLNPTSEDTGTVRLAAASPNLTGLFYIRQGTLLVDVNGALGTNGSTINLGGDSYVPNNAYARLLTNGSVTIDKPVRVRSYTDHNVRATLGGNQTAGASAFTGAITLDLATTLRSNNTDGNVVAFSGGIGGTGGITKAGAGTVSLSGGTLSYGGATIINEGRLLAGGASLPTGTDVTLANTAGAQLDLAGRSQAVNSLNGGGGSGGSVALGSATLTVNSGDYAGTVGGTGGLTKTGAGTLTLSGTNTYTGTTTINAGTLALSNGTAIADSGTVSLANASGATLQLNSGETIGALSGGGAGGGNVNLQGNTLTVGSGSYAGVISGAGGGLTKTGTGTLILGGTGSNSFTGTTTVTGGTLMLNNPGGALASTNALVIGTGGASATVELAQSNQIADTASVTVRHLGQLNVAAATETIGALTLQGGNVTGTLGSLRLGGDVTYAGGANASTISAELLLGDARHVFDVRDGSEAYDLTVAAALTKGGIAKTGEGTLVLAADSPGFDGATVSAGTLLVNASVGGTVVRVDGGTLGGSGALGSGNAQVSIQPGGALSPGASIGTLTISGDLELLGTTRMEIDALKTVGDLLFVEGLLTFGGTMVVTSTPHPFSNGQVFDLFDFDPGVASGEFQEIWLPDPGPGLEWNTNDLYTQGVLQVVPEPAIWLLALPALVWLLLRRRQGRI